MKTFNLISPFYRSLFPLLVLIIGVNLSSNAQNIGVWTLNNTLTGTGTAFNTVGNISLGSGISSGSFNGGTEYYGQNGWPTGGINTNSYIEFSLSPVSSYMLNISTLTLRMRRSNTGSPAGSGPTSWAVRSSLDGFTNDIATGTMTHNYANYTVTPTAFTYLTSTITFRIYGYNATVSSGGNSRFVVDNISVQGATGTLPVHFTLLNARKTAVGTEVKWTAVNINAGTKFGIERSFNGTDFILLDELEETMERLSHNYNFIDRSMPAGKVFYRIRATELSGIVYRTAIVFVDNKSAINFSIGSVVKQGSSVRVSLSVPEKGLYTVNLTSLSGALLAKQQWKLEEGVNSISIPLQNTATGVLVISLYGNGEISSKKFIY